MRIRNHIRSNIIGYLALFFALTGSAVALDGSNTVFSDDIVNGEVKSADIGTAEVTTADIANNTVGAVDLAADSVDNTKIQNNDIRSGDIRNGNVATDDLQDGGVGTVDLADGSVNSAKVLDDSLGTADIGTDGVDDDEVASLNGDANIDDNTLTTFDIATDAIDSDEVLDFGLSNEDVGVLFAQINGDGTVASSSGGVTTIKLGVGTYEVDFGRDISNCAFLVTQGEATPGGAPGAITGVTDRSGNANATFTTVRTDANVLVDRAFQEIVVC